jgi:hypothetical protein
LGYREGRHSGAAIESIENKHGQKSAFGHLVNKVRRTQKESVSSDGAVGHLLDKVVA